MLAWAIWRHEWQKAMKSRAREAPRGMRREPPRPGFEREVVASFRGKIKPRPRLPGQAPERKPWPWPEGHERHGSLPGSVTRPVPLPQQAEVEDETGATRLVRWPRGRRTP